VSATFAGVTLAWPNAKTIKRKNVKISKTALFEGAIMTLRTKKFSAMAPPISRNRLRFLKFYRIMAIFKALYY